MAESKIATIKSITFHPVLCGGDPIPIPVSIDLSFANGPALRYDTSTEFKTYEVEPFQLDINNDCDISGKLYALDRQRGSGYAFTQFETRPKGWQFMFS